MLGFYIFCTQGARMLMQCVCVLLASLFASSLSAQVNGPSDVGQLAQEWANSQLSEQAATPSSSRLRFEVSVGQLDPRLQLAPCSAIEPFVPAGASLWGRSRVGLRCTSGPTRWQVFLPIHVRAFGPALSFRSSLPAGTVLTEEHLQPSQADWAEQTSPVLVQGADWEGKVLARAVSSGEVLRAVLLKPRQLFSGGAPVRLIIRTRAFAIAQDGQALGPGFEGQTVRVRLETGKILTGTAVDERTVKVDLLF